MRNRIVFSTLGVVAFFAALQAPEQAVAGSWLASASDQSSLESLLPVQAPTAPQPQPQSALGGGFLEMLVTGGDPGPRYGGRRYGRQVATTAAPGQIEMRREVSPLYRRQVVEYSGGQPGSIVVDTQNKFLYYVENGGRAIRYGIGVGRPGFEWSGVKTVSRKAEWPDWTPPAEMVARRPDLPRFMPGGPENPLGARALYLGSSLYRIHGTNEPYTIGQNVSSGCIRMMNEDVIDLYDRANVGTRVVVR
ncbi:L,D-transpeptidase [Methylocystis heyeri]|uniref:L,D-transpeptidase family protein n=1 Tax=Methylocystis heyeri TaxID=391905 RepID=A0A6B8KA32_9HYPH|nr:L,D-transpeptidase [Methylocystis heyeri]QGM45154.1 L,D-transpeptidase family protein [Methylocystis heyeri]